MADSCNTDNIRNITAKTNTPVIFKGHARNWPMCQWSVEKWCSVFGTKEIPFRCLKRGFVSDEPCWERRCNIKHSTFKNFLESQEKCDEWMYFDYKYVHQWFSSESELFKEMSWKDFGYPDKGASETTLWVGSRGAHTPAHQDTYGFNIVAQLHGRKRWILFPPETGGLKPTRVPYEESSVYSELNFYCPNNTDLFKGLAGARMIELSAGDALLVPRGWWHYVQNLDPLNITCNIWIPHENDSTTRVSEALIKIFVAQLCKDLPLDTAKLLVNPNEDDISDTPLTVLFLQLETVANIYLDERRKARRVKRQRTREDQSEDATDSKEVDVENLLESRINNIEAVPAISSEELVRLIKGNIAEFAKPTVSFDEDEVDGSTTSLCLTKAVIDAFSQNNVIELVKQNLYTRLSPSY